MLTVNDLIAACVAEGNPEGEAASLRALAEVYEHAARNHDAAGGCRQLLALRLRGLAQILRLDATTIELAALTGAAEVMVGRVVYAPAESR